MKKNIIRCLNERGNFVKVFPMKTSAEEILAFQPDGIMISNGPGDPSVMKEEVTLITKLINSNIPVFGICLGHQLIAQCFGLSTYKTKIGHRGINHPVKNVITGKSEITSQNHGFAVLLEEASKNKDIEITHINLNDNTIEGLRHRTKKVFCVQYHPEASPGPLDARYLFDDFVTLMNSVKKSIPA